MELILRELHSDAKLFLPAKAVEHTVDRYYSALLNQIVDPDDHEEIDLRLRLLRKEVAKDLTEARAAPGSGKRSA